MLRPQFKATKIPRSCAVNIYHQKVEEEERKRRERVRTNAERALDAAAMPKSMQLYADQKKREKAEAPQKPLQEEYPYRPNIGPKYEKDKVTAAHMRLAKQQAKKKESRAGIQF